LPGFADSNCSDACRIRGNVGTLRAGRKRFDELASGKLSRWRELSTEEIEDAGQQEFLNWVCLGGAMHALGREPEIVDYVESYIFNSDKCFALFRP